MGCLQFGNYIVYLFRKKINTFSQQFLKAASNYEVTVGVTVGGYIPQGKIKWKNHKRKNRFRYLGRFELFLCLRFEQNGCVSILSKTKIVYLYLNSQLH